jgi:SagB-type dehydrogenase family enzyme
MAYRIDRDLGRYFLKDDVRQVVAFQAAPQSRGWPAPPLQKPYRPGAQRVKLPAADQWGEVAATSVQDAMRARRSHRDYTEGALTLGELAFLLWATQGLEGRPGKRGARRTVPSAGNRHAFETYLVAQRVTDLPPALYRYLPIEHELVLEHSPGPSAQLVSAAALGQSFVGQAAVVFFWTVIPERMEWRYAEASYKVLAMDAGHVGQNLYLACECVGAGTCTVGAYSQPLCDQLLGVDGQDEFTVYLAPVGKRRT